MSDVKTFPWCGGCWCQNKTICPYSLQPINIWPNSTITYYTSQIPTFLYDLSCNPYEDSTCETTPPQEVISPEVDPSEVVCAYKYDIPRKRPTCDKLQYTMVTYNSITEAENDNAYPTHYGRCGTCSSSRDLALYLSKDLTSSGKVCSTLGVLNRTAGYECYLNLGYSSGCAYTYLYDGIYDQSVCLRPCTTSLGQPNNGPAPECSLNACLQCDEDKAGPIFQQYGGRTRRNSGLQSEIIRSCDSIRYLPVHDPCVALSSSSMNAYISDSGMSENTESPVMTFSIVICVTVVGLLLSIRFYFRRSGQSLKNTAYESIQSHLLKPGYVSDDNVE